MFGERVREWFFWRLDRLKGGPIISAYREIELMCDSETVDEDKIKLKIKSILDYAVQHAGFYMPYKSYSNLQDFPIIDKNSIVAAGKEAFSDQYDLKKLVQMHTSGSSGKQFTSYQNKQKKNRVRAEIAYFGLKCNYRIGDRNLYFRVWSDEFKKSPFSAFKQNMIMIDITRLDEPVLESIRSRLKKERGLKCILGYPSTYEILANYCLHKGDTPDMFKVKVIISSAETLKDSTRKKLQQLFDCDIVSRYSNQENGIMAQEVVGMDYLQLNCSSYYFEFLKLYADEPAEPGELSRIVVTDLYNRAMPMIRYDTKDVAIFDVLPSGRKIIRTVYGRREDQIYDVNDMPVSIGKVDYRLINLNHLMQYQIIQDARGTYRLKVVCNQEKHSWQQLMGEMKYIFGEAANVQIDYVDEITRRSSGKYQIFISNYEPEVTMNMMEEVYNG